MWFGTFNNLLHRATVQPLLQGHGIPEYTQASYVMLQLWSRCKNDSANEEKKKTKQLSDAQRDSNVPDVCPRQQASARGKWNLHAGRRRGATGEELDEWGEIKDRQSWFSFSNKSDNPPVLLWRPPLSPFLSLSYHLSSLPFSQQGMCVCVRVCWLLNEYMNTANEGESH